MVELEELVNKYMEIIGAYITKEHQLKEYTEIIKWDLHDKEINKDLILKENVNIHGRLSPLLGHSASQELLDKLKKRVLRHYYPEEK